MIKLDSKYLLDGYAQTGSDQRDFVALCNEIDRRTSHRVMPLGDLTVLSVKKGQDPESVKVFGALEAWKFDGEEPIQFGGHVDEENLDVSELCGDKEDLIDEIVEQNSLMLRQVGKKEGQMYVSQNLFNTLGQRIVCDGKTLAHNCTGRDLLVAEMLKEYEKLRATLVVKSFEGTEKIFAIMSDKYAAVPLSSIATVVEALATDDRLGKPHCTGWEITHKEVCITFEFPEYAEEIRKTYGLKDSMMPCVKFMTSDIGECSFVAKGYWRYRHAASVTFSGATEKDSFVPDMEFSKEHRGNTINVDSIKKGVEENIFDKYTVLPERLAELMSIELIDPSVSAIISTATGKSRNRAALQGLFGWALDQLRIVDIIGKTRLDELKECIEYCVIKENMIYTAYDVVMDLYSFPDELKEYLTLEEGLGEIAYRKLQKAFSRAPYLDFEKGFATQKATPGSSKVFLTPA